MPRRIGTIAIVLATALNTLVAGADVWQDRGGELFMPRAELLALGLTQCRELLYRDSG